MSDPRTGSGPPPTDSPRARSYHERMNPDVDIPAGQAPSAATPAPATRAADESAVHASHDVLIVGGGLVGASLAIALDRLGLDVGLVEAAPPGALPAVFDERNLSFAEATVNALTALGVLAKLRAPTGSIRRIHISRRGDFGRAVL